MNTLVVACLAFTLLGLIVGSFANVVIARLPARYLAKTSTDKESPPSPSLLWPPSHCPHCLSPIGWRDLIPLVSYVWLRGKCRHCQQGISRQYPIVEAVCALLWLTSFMVSEGYAGMLWPLLLGAVLTILLIIALIDQRYFLVPDELSLGLLWLGLLTNAAQGWLGGLSLPSLTQAIIAVAFGYGVLSLLNAVHRMWRGYSGMGNGDFKIAAALGAWLGLYALPMLLLLAALFGIASFIWQSRKTPIKKGADAGNTVESPFSSDIPQQALPFAPSLCLSGALLLLFPALRHMDTLWDMLFRLFIQ